ncbi:hypothetical protein [Desertihabitans aurantiacus]|uniref:hypothetical protein n=1 Tax=Desertihabitans aurantiacus TaxID=2282477 RepID=UPI0018E53788|nr:hypothetical protein [Desertihabitans aurantiacus]
MAAEYYWCLEHKTVETREGCKALNRLGPYPTREEAAQAMEKVAQRNEQWDAEDERWD